MGRDSTRWMGWMGVAGGWVGLGEVWKAGSVVGTGIGAAIGVAIGVGGGAIGGTIRDTIGAAIAGVDSVGRASVR